MSYAVQPSLLGGDSAPDPPASEPGVFDLIVRHELDRGAWVDVAPGWWPPADSLYARLVAQVPWRAERREMYDRVVEVPRLVAFFGGPAEFPDPELEVVRTRLNERYEPGLGEPLVSAGLCLYRDGADSVAWHGDTLGRARHEDAIVAILSLGAPRPLLLRPRGGGRSRRFTVGHGDLLVMGGSCQRTWEHAVPKSSTPTGPRVSVQFRPRGVR